MSYVERMIQGHDQESRLNERLTALEAGYLEEIKTTPPEELAKKFAERQLAAEGEYKRLQEEKESIEKQLTTDTLVTSVLNHGYFLKVLDREVQETERMPEPNSVLIGLDVDDFRTANEVLGHEGGDQLLVDLGAALAGAVRPGDSAARTGGDEFSLLLRRTNLDNAIMAAQRIKQKVDEAMAHYAKDGFTPTISMGLCLIPRRATASRVRNIADAALYTIKNNGKDRIAIGEINPKNGAIETYIIPSPNQATVPLIPQQI